MLSKEKILTCFAPNKAKGILNKRITEFPVKHPAVVTNIRK